MQPYKYCPYCTSILEEKLVEGHDRSTCTECGWINYRNPVPVVGCLVSNEEGELLLIKRALEPAKGSWALPGGFVELEESPLEAGGRELKEETGLDSQPGRLIGAYSQESELYGAVLIVGVEFIVSAYDLHPGDDAKEAKFFPIDEIPQIPFIAQRKLVKDYLNL